jgi:hypothetical protein
MQDLVNRRLPQPPSRIPPHDQSTRRSPEVYQSVQLPEAGGMMAVDADVFRSDDKRDDKRDESSEVPSRFFSAPRRISVWVTMWLLAVRAPEVLTHSTQAARDKTITHGWRYQAVHCIICVSGAPQLQVTRPPAFTCWADIPTVGKGKRWRMRAWNKCGSCRRRETRGATPRSRLVTRIKPRRPRSPPSLPATPTMRFFQISTERLQRN